MEKKTHTHQAGVPRQGKNSNKMERFRERKASVNEAEKETANEKDETA